MFEEVEVSLAAETRERKRALGIYYTPQRAAEILARWAIKSADDLVLEPSFGGCAMLSAAIAVFVSHGNQEPASQLFGYDIDDSAFDHLARMGIINLQEHFQKGDFLTSEASGLLVDAVLANPPFVSYQRLDLGQRKIVGDIRKKYLPSLHRKASLWAYFLLHAMSFLRTGGRMAFVLPNAIGTADYARPILSFLEKKFAKVELFHVTEQLFIQTGADERVSLLLLDGHTPEGRASPAKTRRIDILNIRELETFETRESHETETLRIHDVRKYAAEALASLSGVAFDYLGNVAEVRIGEVVGDISYFARARTEWTREGIGQEYLVPLLTRAAQAPGLGTNGPVGEGRIRYLLIPPAKVKKVNVKAYLEKYGEAAILANQTFSRRKVWFRCSYEKNADAFIGSMNHEFPRIVANDARISASNAFYKITVCGPREYAHWLPAISLTTPMRLSAELLGRVRGSGGIKLEPSDVKKLIIPATLPNLSSSEFQELQSKLDSLVRAGEIESANSLADSYVFIRTGLLDETVIAKLRSMRLSLTHYRFGAAAKNG